MADLTDKMALVTGGSRGISAAIAKRMARAWRLPIPRGEGDWAPPQIAMTALKRYGHVDELAALVAFVAGPEASYVTDANLTVDGGTNA